MIGFSRYLALWTLLAVGLIGLLGAGEALAARPLVKKITTESGEAKFTLRVFLNTRLAPKVFPIDVRGKKPRLVVDFNKASGVRGLPRSLKTSSGLVRLVRVGIHKKPKPKIRLVLDLVPGFSYQADQWFRKDNNSYILVITAQ